MFPNGLVRALKAARQGKLSRLLAVRMNFFESQTKAVHPEPALGSLEAGLFLEMNTGIIQIIFPCCYTNLMVIMQSLTLGRRCRRDLVGARKCSQGDRDGSPTYIRKGETLISPDRNSPEPALRLFLPCLQLRCCGWTNRQRSVLHAIKERFYYTRLPPGLQEAAGEEAAAPFWHRLV